MSLVSEVLYTGLLAECLSTGELCRDTNEQFRTVRSKCVDTLVLV